MRETATQTITLPKNDTDKPWTLSPVISHEFWTGPVSVEVPARGTASYPLTYRPLFMTKDGGPPDAPAPLPGVDPLMAQVGLGQHTGSVFFPLPDGTGALYSLVGKAAAPSPQAPPVAAKTAAKKMSRAELDRLADEKQAALG